MTWGKVLNILLKERIRPVAYAYNPSYSGGRDQEDYGSKAAWENSLPDPILKIPHHKKSAGGVAQGIGPEFKPQHHKKTKKKESESKTPYTAC
jgi:hypothetical protein